MWWGVHAHVSSVNFLSCTNIAEIKSPKFFIFRENTTSSNYERGSIIIFQKLNLHQNKKPHFCLKIIFLKLKAHFLRNKSIHFSSCNEITKIKLDTTWYFMAWRSGSQIVNRNNSRSWACDTGIMFNMSLYAVLYFTFTKLSKIYAKDNRWQANWTVK